MIMATAGPKHVRRFMYVYIKQVTLDGTITYFNIKQCEGSICLLLTHVQHSLFIVTVSQLQTGSCNRIKLTIITSCFDTYTKSSSGVHTS
jgi:hypothetical protein